MRETINWEELGAYLDDLRRDNLETMQREEARADEYRKANKSREVMPGRFVGYVMDENGNPGGALYEL